jgi:hypothetical protein
MALGRKTGGRVKGSKNIMPLAVSEICAQEHYDPIRDIIRIAKKRKQSEETRLDAASKILPYLYAKPTNPSDVPQGTFFQVTILQAGAVPEAPAQLPEALDIKVNRL